jgi:hypothetical protein
MVTIRTDDDVGRSDLIRRPATEISSGGERQIRLCLSILTGDVSQDIGGETTRRHPDIVKNI